MVPHFEQEILIKINNSCHQNEDLNIEGPHFEQEILIKMNNNCHQNEDPFVIIFTTHRSSKRLQIGTPEKHREND